MHALPLARAEYDQPIDDERIDLLEIVVRFVVEWRLGLRVAGIVLVIGIIMILCIRPRFEARATVMPQSSDSSGSVASYFSRSSPADAIIGLLESRSVQYRVVDHAGLLNFYHAKTREAAAGRLGGSTRIGVDKDTFIEITVRDGDAGMACNIANAYLDALEEQEEAMTAHRAEVTGRFLEGQLDKESAALGAAEQDLRRFQESTGLIQPEAQTEIGLSAIASTRAQISNLQVQLAALLQGASENNAGVKTIRSQIAELAQHEHELELNSRPGGAGSAAAAAKMPGLNLDYARTAREVKFHEALFNSLANQLEASRLSVGASPPFQIVDHAIVPDHKAWPPRKLLLLLLLCVSCLGGIVAIALKLLWRRILADPAQRGHLSAMRNSFRSAS